MFNNNSERCENYIGKENWTLVTTDHKFNWLSWTKLFLFFAEFFVWQTHGIWKLYIRKATIRLMVLLYFDILERGSVIEFRIVNLWICCGPRIYERRLITAGVLEISHRLWWNWTGIIHVLLVLCAHHQNHQGRTKLSKFRHYGRPQERGETSPDFHRVRRFLWKKTHTFPMAEID